MQAKRMLVLFTVCFLTSTFPAFPQIKGELEPPPAASEPAPLPAPVLPALPVLPTPRATLPTPPILPPVTPQPPAVGIIGSEMKPPVQFGQTTVQAADLSNYCLPFVPTPAPQFAASAGGYVPAPPQSIDNAQHEYPNIRANQVPGVMPYNQGQNLAPFLSSGNVGQGKYLDQKSIKAVTQLIRGIMAVRSLPATPHNDALIRKVLEIPSQCTNLLHLRTFPVLPRFTARADENVLRDRSYDAFEYRQFGSFQTVLNGWIKPSTLEINVDFKFTARGRSYATIKGVITERGALTAKFIIEGSDAYGGFWSLKCEAKELLLRDDGFPSCGWLQISGWDPFGQSMLFSVTFPVEKIDAMPRPSKSRLNQSPLQPPRRY